MTGTTSDSCCEETPAPPRMWSVDEHLADVLSDVVPLPPIELQLLDAQGCRLAEDVSSEVDLPPFDNSSMDGYAVRTTDTAGATEQYPSVLTVVGEIAAGAGELPKVGPGQTARIMTGAPVPPGAEAVAPVEWTDGGSGTGRAADAMTAAPADRSDEVRVLRPVTEGAHIRRRGSDLSAGERVLEAGALLGPTQLGLLAAIGRGTVRVRPRPRVVVLSTGSELVQPGDPVGPGQISDSNSFTLTAAAQDAGAIAYRVGGVPDDASVLRAVLEDQLGRADLIVTSGGVSVGAYDVVKEVFAEYGEMDFRRLRMQPGKPQGFGRIQGTPLLALPGNPVSSYISFELFVRPVIRTMMGAPDIHRPVVRAVCTADLRSPAGRRQFLRGWYSPEDGEVAPVGGEGSHLVGALARANCLIAVPEDETSVAAGRTVDVVLLTG
ncbi:MULTISPECIES: gephyrin-like molybdotransferase Glp [unclassified Kitasatospora]|uniref:molybdotransferase-like divisome protein Glp n=1 Tax=unclassified Kitasatospora TaxID=2633591 RepID=UPI00070F98C3|nr:MULTISPECIES: gephyrin-like molybdotransferase Glp [unclassified Kitasatospora]KQV24033.1 molybdopterin biosynthesis protein MoeA [Kitasatospora sp. Root107]KRB67253.1 molybdopterin biosynthesis protein MoeA [Kitasatospora sp. Root187]